MVNRAKGQLRRIDVVARLGGGEFAFLLPETDQSEARTIISKVQIELLEEMRQNSWPITFSVGVLTSFKTRKVPDELIKQADVLMYSVKKQWHKRNQLCHLRGVSSGYSLVVGQGGYIWVSLLVLRLTPPSWFILGPC